MNLETIKEFTKNLIQLDKLNQRKSGEESDRKVTQIKIHGVNNDGSSRKYA